MTSTNELLYRIMLNAPRSRDLIIKDDLIDDALKTVTGFHTEELREKNRRRELSMPRQIGIFFYLCAGYSLKQTGLRFHRDHATALYARTVIKNLYGQKGEKELTERIDLIERITGINTGLQKQAS